MKIVSFDDLLDILQKMKKEADFIKIVSSQDIVLVGDEEEGVIGPVIVDPMIFRELPGDGTDVEVSTYVTIPLFLALKIRFDTQEHGKKKEKEMIIIFPLETWPIFPFVYNNGCYYFVDREPKSSGEPLDIKWLQVPEEDRDQCIVLFDIFSELLVTNLILTYYEVAVDLLQKAFKGEDFLVDYLTKPAQRGFMTSSA